jgi:hypothetical protein
MRATMLLTAFIVSIALSLPSTAFSQPTQAGKKANKERCQNEIRNSRCRGNDACMQAARARCTSKKSGLTHRQITHLVTSKASDNHDS